MARSRSRPVAAWSLAIALAAIAAPSARAEYFEFTSAVSIDVATAPPGSVIANPPGGLSASVTTPNGNQVILNALASNPSIPRNNASGIGTDIVPLNVRANASFASEVVGLGFTLTLTLTDYAGPQDLIPSPGANPITFVFNGTIGGQLGSFQTNLKLLSFVPEQTTAVVGGAEYTIELNNFSSPGPDTGGRLTLHVTAHAVPEPGSLILMGIGFTATLGVAARRRLGAKA